MKLFEGNYLFLFLQLLSIEDVERIMDDTAAGIEYQRVRFFFFLNL